MNKDEFNEIYGELNVDNISRHIEWLTKETPYRISSGADVVKAADYVCDQMKSFGLEVKNENFYTYNSTPISSNLEVISPVREHIDSRPCCHIRSTAPEGEICELVYLTSEDYANIEKLDIKGKVVLVEMSYTPPLPEKARLLSEYKAAGMICMNWGNDEPVICGRGIKTVWGNPTEETFKQIPNITAIGITRKDGLKLKDLCMSGKVTIKIQAESTKEWQQVPMPFGILKGNGESDQLLLVASHIDAWEPGVTCNATGNALTLELARVLAANADKLKRDIWFVFWNGHEIAEAAGSTWFLDNHWEELNRRAVNYMHIDSPGMRDAQIYEIKCADELIDFAKRNAESISSTPLRIMHLKKIGDMSCLGIGIPGISQRMAYTEEQMAKDNGATLGWWNHTCEDGLDKYSKEIISKDAEYTLSFLYELATEEYLPYKFGDKLARYRQEINSLQSKYSKHLNLDDLGRLIDQCAEKLNAIEQNKEKYGPTKYNEFVLYTARCLTNVFQTYTDKWNQDSYGNWRLSKPIPLLCGLERADKMTPNTLEYGFVITETTRNKNRIVDALQNVLFVADFMPTQNNLTILKRNPVTHQFETN